MTNINISIPEDFIQYEESIKESMLEILLSYQEYSFIAYNICKDDIDEDGYKIQYKPFNSKEQYEKFKDSYSNVLCRYDNKEIG